MKNLMARRPLELKTAAARMVGMDPANKQAAKVYRGPIRSHIGPATTRTRRVAQRPTMLELATSVAEAPMSLEMVKGRSGGNAYLV